MGMKLEVVVVPVSDVDRPRIPTRRWAGRWTLPLYGWMTAQTTPLTGRPSDPAIARS
jgi:hypothetical protein